MRTTETPTRFDYSLNAYVKRYVFSRETQDADADTSVNANANGIRTKNNMFPPPLVEDTNTNPDELTFYFCIHAKSRFSLFVAYSLTNKMIQVVYRFLKHNLYPSLIIYKWHHARKRLWLLYFWKSSSACTCAQLDKDLFTSTVDPRVSRSSPCRKRGS